MSIVTIFLFFISLISTQILIIFFILLLQLGFRNMSLFHLETSFISYCLKGKGEILLIARLWSASHLSGVLSCNDKLISRWGWQGWEWQSPPLSLLSVGQELSACIHSLQDFSPTQLVCPFQNISATLQGCALVFLWLFAWEICTHSLRPSSNSSPLWNLPSSLLY